MDVQDLCAEPLMELGGKLLAEGKYLTQVIADPDGIPAQELIKAADLLRAQTVGDEVHLRALIEFSSYCGNNCSYCGLRRDNSQVSRYRLTPEEILKTAATGARLGYRTVVLQSGEDPVFRGEGLAEIIREIRRWGSLSR